MTPSLAAASSGLDDGRAAAPIDLGGSLGALDGSGLLSLLSLDGEAPSPSPTVEARSPTVEARSSSSDAPTAPAASAQAHPIGTRAGAATSLARPRDEPVDVFLPPSADDADEIVELAEDELAHRARKQRTAPPPPAAEPGARRPPAPSDPLGRAPADEARRADVTAPESRRRSPAPAPPLAPGPPATFTPRPRPDAVRSDAARTVTAPTGAARTRAARLPPSWGAAQLGRLAPPRMRFAAGVLLAIVLGFVPAYLVASIREASAFHAIDDKVRAIQGAVDSEDGYAALDGFRAEQLRLKRSARQMIALTSLVIWAAAGGGLAYAWFKRVPWDRLG